MNIPNLYDYHSPEFKTKEFKKYVMDLPNPDKIKVPLRLSFVKRLKVDNMLNVDEFLCHLYQGVTWVELMEFYNDRFIS